MSKVIPTDIHPRRGCEMDQFGNEVGRHPREVSLADLLAMGHRSDGPLKALRRKCMDCCGYQVSEVTKCVATTCPAWPYRMATNPFRKPHTLNQRANSKRQAEKLRRRAAIDHGGIEKLATDVEGIDPET